MRVTSTIRTTLCATLALLTVPGVAVADAEPVAECGKWTTSQEASGFGILENLAFDGRGGMLLSELPLTTTGGAVQRLGPDGSRQVAAEANFPGGIVVSGDTAYFTTGGNPISGFSDRADGTIEALNLDSGTVSTVATGLTAPNGLAQTGDGEFVVSRDLGDPSLLTTVARDGLGVLAPDLTSTNGLAYDQDRRKLFVSTTFEPVTTIAAIDTERPDAAPDRITLPGMGPLNAADDLTVGPDGNVYVALNAAGRVVRVNPDTGDSCVIAEGLLMPTSAAFGAGPGWDPNALYVTSFLGTVTRLTP